MSKMKRIAAQHLQTEVTEVVITVPACFHTAQRRIIRDGATLAGLRVLQLMNETTATALTYANHRQQAKKRRVVVVDCGAGSIDVSFVSVKALCVKIKSSYGNRLLGGVDVDSILDGHIKRIVEDALNTTLATDTAVERRVRAASQELKSILSNASTARSDLHQFVHASLGKEP